MKLKKVWLFLSFVSFFSFANAGIIELQFDKKWEGKDYQFKIGIENLDDLQGKGDDTLDNIIRQIEEQAKAQGIDESTLGTKIDDLKGGNGLNDTILSLTVAGEKVVLGVDASGNIKLEQDDLGLFDGIDFSDLNVSNLDNFVASNSDFTEKIKVRVDEITESGELYSILSKVLVKEEKRKIRDTATSAVGGNPLSAMYLIAENDFYLSVNDSNIDSYSYPQVYFASVDGGEVLSARLPLNFMFDFFGLLDPLGLSFRFDLPLSYYQYTKNGDKVFGGSLGVGLALRWIVPENFVSNWSLTFAYKPLTLSAAINDRLKVTDEEEIMQMEDLSLLPEISIFNSYSLVSKKTWGYNRLKSFFVNLVPTKEQEGPEEPEEMKAGAEYEKLRFTLVNSLSFVNSWSKSSIKKVVSKFGVLDKKTENIIPEFDLHNTFFKNGIIVDYQPFKRVLIGGELTYTVVSGKTEVYVPNYLTLAFNISANYDMWVFSTPTFRLSYTTGSNDWSDIGLALKLNF
jgi:hypothetical protein